MKKTLSIAVIATAFLCGCQMGAQQADAYARDQPPAYKLAFANGCDSGNAAAGQLLTGKHVKDVQRYATDNIYKQGWDDGFAKCKGATDASSASLNSRRW